VRYAPYSTPATRKTEASSAKSTARLLAAARVSLNRSNRARLTSRQSPVGPGAIQALAGCARAIHPLPRVAGEDDHRGMATDIAVYLDDRPGELARLSQILGDADVNIGGMCAVTSGGGAAEVHLLVDDLAPALEALEGAGVEIAGEQEVIVVPLEDRPGALAEVARRLGDAEINITLAYLATSTRLALATNDFEGAMATLRTD
jgi:hypothetical protein